MRKALALALALASSSFAGWRGGFGGGGGGALTAAQSAVLALLSESGGNIVLASGAALETEAIEFTPSASAYTLGTAGNGFMGYSSGRLGISAGAGDFLDFHQPDMGTLRWLIDTSGNLVSNSDTLELRSALITDRLSTGAPTLSEGATIATGKDITLDEDARIMIGTSGDGLQVRDDGGVGRLNFVGNGTEDANSFLELDGGYMQLSNSLKGIYLLGGIEADYVDLIAQSTVSNPNANEYRVWADTDEGGTVKWQNSAGASRVVAHDATHTADGYQDGDQTITVSAANTYYQVALDTSANASGALSVDDAGDEIDYDGTAAGTYEFVWAVSLASAGGGTKTIACAVFEDGVIDAASEQSRTMSGSSDLGAMAGVALIDLAGSAATIDVRCENRTDTNNLTVNHVNLAGHWVGN